MYCSQNALKSLEKRSDYVLEKSGKPVRFLYEPCSIEVFDAENPPNLVSGHLENSEN